MIRRRPESTDLPAPTRRQFLIGGGAALGLVVAAGALVPSKGGALAATGPGPAEGAALNAWVRITPDGVVEITCGRSEMGQGIHTGLATLVAEELGCRWQDIRVTTGLPDAVFKNITGGRNILAPNAGFAQAEEEAGWFLTKLARVATEQFTGGSTGIPDGFFRAREAGAMARSLLIAAAAAGWGVAPAACTAADGVVTHGASGRTASYGALAAAAARLDPPDEVALKPRAEWTLIGTTPPRVDIPAKVDGSALYAGDIRRPGMVYAAIMNAPTLGGALTGMDGSSVLSLPGVRAVLPVPGGVAVVADSTWRARKALAMLRVTWNPGPHTALDSAAIDRTLTNALDGDLTEGASAGGDVDQAFDSAARVVTAEYRLPYLAHATMEPMACTAELGTDGVLTVWAPVQAQTRALAAAADAAGVSKSDVRLHTTYLGGGFGRRGEVDHIAQAAALAAALKVPVQASWSREEEMRHDFYRPAAVTRMEAALAADGTLLGWRQRVATQSIMARVFPPATWIGPDKTMLEGGDHLPYAVPAMRMAFAQVDLPVPVGPWRSVGHSLHGFFVESFLDEVAAAAGRDPLDLRRSLLTGEPRMRALLDLAAEKAGWGTPLPPGQGRGIALHRSFNSAVAQVVEVAVAGTQLTIRRVVAAVDCGTLINPGIVEAQVMSAIADGLSAALYGEITVAAGAVVQGNFDSYDMIRLARMPVVEVHAVPSTDPPGGIGEPGLPPVAPALANAIFAATGRRIRRLPLVREGFTV